MIYLIDRGFRNKSALNILVNQCKHQGIYNECFCLGCNVNDNANDNVNDKNNDNDNDLRSSFANNDNDNNNDNIMIMIILMIMIMIYEVALLMILMIMIIREPAWLATSRARSQMIEIMIVIKIILYIREPAWQIYLMKDMVKHGKPSPIKRVNLTIIPPLTISS